MSNAKVVGVLLGGVCLGAAVGVAVTSTVLKNNASRTTSASSGSCSVDGATSQTAALFEVDGKQYTREDLSTEMQDQLFQMQSQLHDASANLVKEVALRFALAKDKKIDVGSGKELPDLKTLMEPKKVTEADMKAFLKKIRKAYRQEPLSSRCGRSLSNLCKVNKWASRFAKK